MKIKIEAMDHNGSGIGRIDDKVVFVPKSRSPIPKSL